MKKIMWFLAVIGVSIVIPAYAFEIESKYKEYANPNFIISPAHLKELINSNTEKIVVVDVRKKEDYAKGHIDGAVNIWRPDYEADKNEYKYTGMRPKPEKLYALLGKLGIDENTRVVTYTGSAAHDAYRVAWMLRMYGHSPEPINVLGGAFNAWKKAGFVTSDKVATPTAVTYTPLMH